MSIVIKATDREGGTHELEADIDATVMETLRDAGLPVEAICGGCCSCATCHVYVAPSWLPAVGPRNDSEDELLQLATHLDDKHSRLSCQIRIREELDGLAVTLAPEE